MRINRLGLQASVVLRLARIIVALMLAFGNLLAAPIASAEPVPAETATPTDTAAPTETATATNTPTPTGPPTIISDQADYNPGTTVTLTGANWQPGEIVHIFANDDVGQTWNHNVDVIASASGTIVDVF